jgi:hypothetical protein
MKVAKYLILIVSLLVFPSYSWADELDELCKKQLCRKPFTVSLQKKMERNSRWNLTAHCPLFRTAGLPFTPARWGHHG